MKKIGELPSGRAVFIDGSEALDPRDALSLAQVLLQEYAPQISTRMLGVAAFARIAEELGVPVRITAAIEHAVAPPARPRPRNRRPR